MDRTVNRSQILAVCELLGLDSADVSSITIERDLVSVTRRHQIVNDEPLKIRRYPATSTPVEVQG